MLLLPWFHFAAILYTNSNKRDWTYSRKSSAEKRKQNWQEIKNARKTKLEKRKMSERKKQNPQQMKEHS